MPTTLIFGASRGLGRAFTHHALSQGHRVVALVRSPEMATELSKRDTGKTLYILDEPTTGLHFEDIRVLMNVLNKLVDKGNTVIVIEHNLDVIKMADYIIDMGPEGGKGGGELLSCGTPEEVAMSTKGYTPKFLKEELHL